jgi:ribonuclease PH
MRPTRLLREVVPDAEGSCLVEMGNTRVICAATVEAGLPPHRKAGGHLGWLTAEYGMLPRSSPTRIVRENRGPSGRTQEIQRLIGRSLRTAIDLPALGERTITIDCDVLRADGGTRCASVTGAWVAVSEACRWLVSTGALPRSPVIAQVAAISVGVVKSVELLDLCYQEDSQCDVDMNVVATDQGRYIEVQGTGERQPFDRDRLDRLLDLAKKGLDDLFRLQREALG